MKTIRIATRNSPLAMWQANYVKDRLLEAHQELNVEIVGMTTKGDQILDRSLVSAGGKGLFLKELEVSMLDGATDIAVHSMKDVPVDLPRGLKIAAVCERADARDAFVSNEFQNLYALPVGARVGTSSLRRVSQLKKAFPALEFIELRGNVNTRLRKLDSGDYDAIILAAAGLIRLGLEGRIKQYISPELCLPAVGQGIIGIECRSDDEETIELLQPLHSRQSEIFLAAERAMNASLEGGCQVPVAGFAEIVKGKIRMRGLVGDLDGEKVLSSDKSTTDISLEAAADVGKKVAVDLLKQGAGLILSSVYNEPVLFKKVDLPVVLLTRQHRYLGNTAAILQRLDYQPTHIPTLKIDPTESDELNALFDDLDKYTDLVFVSRNAVEIGMNIISGRGGVPKGVRVMAVGAETAKQLHYHGIDAMFPDHGSGAEALLKVAQLEDLTDRNILVIRGESGLDWPAEEMRRRGAEAEQAKVYKQSIPSDTVELLAEVMEHNHNIDGVFIHSSQSLRNLVKAAGQYRERLSQARLVVGSKKIAATAKRLEWKGPIAIAKSPSNKHMMIAFSE